MKIIIVDDNETFRNSLKYYLENMLLHEVIATANDGEEFLNLKDIHLADVILIDIEMPNMNGIEAAKKVLFLQYWLKLIAITSYTDRAYLIELMGAGFKACVFKNNIYEELQEALSKLSNDKPYWPRDMKIINKN